MEKSQFEVCSKVLKKLYQKGALDELILTSEKESKERFDTLTREPVEKLKKDFGID